MLEKLFESLDEKVFTDELKESLTTSFNEAVDAKTDEKVEELIEAKIEELSEKAEEYKEVLAEEAKEKEAALMEQVDTYLEKVVEDFVTEAEESLAESLKNEKADLMIESFDAHIIACGVDVKSIVEAKDESEAEFKLAESIEKYDTLIEANIELEKENADLLKMGVISEMKEGMSIVEAEKFAKLAEIVEFSKDKEYAEKLETLKESLKGAKIDEVVVIDESLTEDAKKLEENRKSYSHLV